jgi:hypothetical protein
MKRTLVLAMAALCVAGLAWGQSNVGTIGVFTDDVAGSCDIADEPALVTAHILHVGAVAANTSTFMLRQDPGVEMLFVSATLKNGLMLGDVRTGVTVTYTPCRTSFPFELFELNYLGSGTSTACGKIEIVGAPVPFSHSGNIEIIDCSYQIFEVLEGGHALVNVAGDCGCQNIPTEETTWGKVKSLYQ